jgi:hypothetical protein
LGSSAETAVAVTNGPSSTVYWVWAIRNIWAFCDGGRTPIYGKPSRLLAPAAAAGTTSAVLSASAARRPLGLRATALLAVVDPRVHHHAVTSDHTAQTRHDPGWRWTRPASFKFLLSRYRV